MKRFLIIALLLATGAVLALPGAVGVVAEQQQERIVNQIGDVDGQLVREHYSRGWFNSESRYRYRIEDEQLRKLAAAITKEPAGSPELIVTTVMHHGPVPLISGGSSPLAWTDMDSTLVLRAPSGVDIDLPGELRSRIEADGSSHFVYSAENGNRKLANGLTLAWEKTDVDVALGRNRQDLRVDGDIGVVRLHDNNAEISFGPAKLLSDQQRTDSGLWTGSTDIRAVSIALQDIEADDLSLVVRAQESAGLATYAVELGALNLRGQGLRGADARIEFLAERLDAAALSGLIELVSQSPGTGPIPLIDRDALLRKLLRAGPEITVRTLQIPMPGATLEGDAFISVEPGTGSTPRELARGVEATTTLLLPKSLIEQLKTSGPSGARDTIALMQQFRLLKPVGNRYRVEAKYAGNLLWVNGLPVPVPAF